MRAPDYKHPSDGHSSVGVTIDTLVEADSLHARSIHTSPASGLAAEPGIRGWVAAHPLLGSLPERERLTLLEWSRIRHAPRYEVIYREGEPANTVFLVLQGYARSTKSTADGREVFLALAGPHDCAGAITALQRQPYEADLTSLSMCRLLAIDARQFCKVFERQPEGLLAILRMAGDQYQHVAERLTDYYTLTAAGRLAKALLDLARSSAPEASGHLAVHLSQHELGMLANSTRETVNKQLKVLLAAGGVSMSDGKVTAIRADSLSGFTSGADQERQTRRVTA
jgi:CRP/FNR family transcriptional regulator, cyclic AMP receptor protein